MPRALLDKNNGKFRKLHILVNGAVSADNKNSVAIGKAIGTCRNTAQKYLENPEKLPLEKLLKLGRNLGIPIEELRECIRY